MLSIVLSRRDFREYDQIVSVYTKDAGKKELLAKGIKKIVSKNASYLEPFFLVDLEWVDGREMSHLTKVVPEHSFPEILKNSVAIQMVKKSFALVDRVVHPHEKDEKIFALLFHWLLALNTTKPETALLDIFYLRLWQSLGLAPQLYHCQFCQKKGAWFAPIAGGLLCVDHANREADQLPMSPTAIDLFKQLGTSDFIQANELIKNPLYAKEVALPIKKFIEYHSPIRLRAGLVNDTKIS